MANLTWSNDMCKLIPQFGSSLVLLWACAVSQKFHPSCILGTLQQCHDSDLLGSNGEGWGVRRCRDGKRKLQATQTILVKSVSQLPSAPHTKTAMRRVHETVCTACAPEVFLRKQLSAVCRRVQCGRPGVLLHVYIFRVMASL